MVERIPVKNEVRGPNPRGGAKSLRSLETALQFKEDILYTEFSPGSTSAGSVL